MYTKCVHIKLKSKPIPGFGLKKKGCPLPEAGWSLALQTGSGLLALKWRFLSLFTSHGKDFEAKARSSRRAVLFCGGRGNVFGYNLLFEPGAEQTPHHLWSSQAHPLQGRLRGYSRLLPRNPQEGWLEGQGSHFKVWWAGVLPALNSLEIYQYSEAWGSMLQGFWFCVCVLQVCMFLVEKEAVILTSSPDGSDVGGQWTRLRDFTSRTYRMLQIQQK